MPREVLRYAAGESPRYDGVAEMWFDNFDAMRDSGLPTNTARFAPTNQNSSTLPFPFHNRVRTPDRVTRPHPDFFENGIDLFNEGRFFECHEAWEEVWKRSDGEQKLFYQGLIQAAVAILHAQRGNLQGARSM